MSILFHIRCIAVSAVLAGATWTSAYEPVHQYSLQFQDSNWQEILEANYVNDDGYLVATFSDGDITLDSVGVRYKGNSSYLAASHTSKKPFKIKFNEFRKEQRYHGVEVLNFSNAYGDPSFIREKIAYDIARKYLPTPKASFATITIHDTLIGLYTEVEQIDEIFLAKWFADPTLNLFKASDAGSGLTYLGNNANLYESQIELKTNESDNDWTGLLTFLNFINNTTESEFCSSYPYYLNADNVTAFLALNMALSHFDSYTGSGRNYYTYQESSYGKMQFIPWDLNLAFGGYSNGWDVYMQSPLSTSNISDRPLLQKVLACTALRYKYLAYIQAMIQGPASKDSIQWAIDNLVPIIDSFVYADPNKFYSNSDFETNITTKLRTSSGSIPGIMEFTELRNPYLQSIIDTALPSGYTLPVKTTKNHGLTTQIHNGILDIHINDSNIYLIQIFDLKGHLMNSNRFTNGPHSIRLSKGIHAVRVNSNKITQHFLIQIP